MTRYIQLNAEFQRIARRGKKAFFNEKFIKLEENNRMAKTRDLFTVYQVSTISVLYCAHLWVKCSLCISNFPEEIKKRWKEYMEELYQKGLNELGYYDGVVSHPEPDILESKV